MEHWKFILLDYAVTLGWALVGAVSMGAGIGVALKVFSWLTPRIDEIEELKKGNISVAIVLAAVVLATAIVVAVAVLPEAARPAMPVSKP